jgi:hypothetical protein
MVNEVVGSLTYKSGAVGVNACLGKRAITTLDRIHFSLSRSATT